MSSSEDNIIHSSIADRYWVTGTLGEGAMGAVLRGVPISDPSHGVAIKIIQRKEQLSHDDILRFQKEAALMSKLYHPNIVTFHELGLLSSTESHYGQGYYIVMEIVKGNDLKVALKEGRQFSIEEVIKIGIQISAALDYTHGKDIIHRDIKSQNIIINDYESLDDLVVKVLDFGVAKLGDPMNFSGDSNKVREIAGTPLYMAPEMTQYVKEQQDHRVDLYSLGCVLYELISGKPPHLPEKGETVAKLHATRDPKPFPNDVPQELSDVIFKLLAKNPKDRYSTAFSAHVDLLNVEKIIHGEMQQENFHLATYNQFHSVSAKLNLIDRDEELEKIMNAYDAVNKPNGRSRITVIEGSVGTGKTRLLSEFRTILKEKETYFVSGSFSSHASALSFNALANAFNEYLTRILKTQHEEAINLASRIRATLGETAPIIASIIPALQPYINTFGKDLPPASFENIDFNELTKHFSDFTKCLAPEGKPIVFIFDDLQWADEKSLKLIDTFLSHNNSERFYVVFSYQKQTLSENLLLEDFFDKFRKLRRRFQEIELRPAGENTTNKLIQEILQTTSDVSKLNEIIFDKAHGIPSYVNEYLRMYIRKGFLTHQPKTGWNYNISQMEADSSIPGSVDLAISRIQSLKKDEQNILRAASLIGLSFKEEILKLSYYGCLFDKLIQIAVAKGIITKDGNLITFTHPRIREILYNSLTEEEKHYSHWLLATKIDKHKLELPPQDLFSLALHYNQGLTQDASIEYKRRAICISIQAADELILAQAYYAAETYLNSSLKVCLENEGIDPNNEFNVQIKSRIARISYFTKRFNQAISLYNDLITISETQVAKSEFIYQKIEALILAGFNQTALRTAEKALMALGVTSNYQFRNKLTQVMPKVFQKIMRRQDSWETPQETNSEYWIYKFSTTASLIALQVDFEYAKKLFKLSQTVLPKSTNKNDLECSHSMVEALFLYFKGDSEKASEKLPFKNPLLTSIEKVFLIYVYEQITNYADFCNEEAIATLGKNIEKMRLNGANKILIQTLSTQLDFNRFLAGKNTKFKTPPAYEFEEIEKPQDQFIKNKALNSFQSLIQNNRQKIVEDNKHFGRHNDIPQAPFELVHSIICHHARGETKKAKEAFEHIESTFEGFTHLLPVEQDFLSLFVMIFPKLFELENHRFLIKEKELGRKLDKLYQVLLKTRKEDELPLRLISYTSRNLLGDISDDYDPHFQFEQPRSLIEAWAAFTQTTVEASISEEYATEGITAAMRFFRATGSKQLLKSLLEACNKYDIVFDDLKEVTTNNVLPHSKYLDFPTAIAQNSIRIFMESIKSLDLDTFFQKCAYANETNYGATCTAIFVMDQTKGFKKVFSSSGDPEFEDHLFQSFFDLQAPQAFPNSVIKVINERTIVSQNHEKTIESQLESTQVPFEEMDATVVTSKIVDETVTFVGQTTEQTMNMMGDNTTHNTFQHTQLENASIVIPFKMGNGSPAIMVMENIQYYASEVTRTHTEELIVYSSVLSLFDKALTNDSLDFLYNDYLEGSEWLSVIPVEKICNDHVSSWSIGANLDDDYLLVNMSIKGHDIIRHEVSALLWIQAMTWKIRSELFNESITTYGVRDELNSIISLSPKFKYLEDVSIISTYFNRSQQSSITSQYGNLRPLIFGGEAEVIPNNNELLSFDNGRQFRYWEISSVFKSTSTYYVPSFTRLSTEITPEELQNILIELENLGNDLTNLTDRQMEIFSRITGGVIVLSSDGTTVGNVRMAL